MHNSKLVEILNATDDLLEELASLGLLQFLLLDDVVEKLTSKNWFLSNICDLFLLTIFLELFCDFFESMVLNYIRMIKLLGGFNFFL